ncbi:MAG: hypothetical protein JWS10_4223 [Cypionkella sp.]|uniref:hypothetical protein n=1 Tax=Cypionkella sp. TaxID=2811411 RepID=UPI002627CACA|nr:hypothetical protein [Cypionkella sp.]MDB5661608.1 hypothetical protein [Cypionkella sp.]
MAALTKPKTMVLLPSPPFRLTTEIIFILLPLFSIPTPIIRDTAIPRFHGAALPPCRASAMPLIRAAAIPRFSCSANPLYRCPVHPPLRYPVFPLFRFANALGSSGQGFDDTDERAKPSFISPKHTADRLAGELATNHFSEVSRYSLASIDMLRSRKTLAGYA